MEITILHIKAEEHNAIVTEKECDLSTAQKLVGGYIERIMITDEIDLWLNEEGKLDELHPNFNLIRNGRVVDVVVGDVFFASHDDEGNMASLTDEMLIEIQERFIDRRNFVL